jgi:hypothetical protein
MIVDTLEILKQHVATIAAVNSFSLFKSYVEAAENWVKTQLLGADLFDFVEVHKSDKAHSALVGRVQRIIALNGFDRSVPFMDLVQTNNGFAVTDTEGLVPASKERVASLRAGVQRECDAAIEDLLLFLEDNEAYHDEWKGAPVYTLLTDTFLPTFTLFQRYAPYNTAVDAIYPKCRLEFARLNGKLRGIMASQITNVLGTEFTDDLLEELRDGDLTAANKKLVEPLRFALGLYTLGLDAQADKFMGKITALLKAHPEQYPVWATSPEGVAALTPPIAHTDTPIFMMI